MKWNLVDLRKTEFPLNFDYQLELKEELLKRNSDLLNASPVIITGHINKIKNDEYLVYLNIKTKLILRCQVSLEPIDYDLDLNETQGFGNEEDDYQFKSGFLDITDLIMDSIIFHIPMKIVKKGFEDKYNSNKNEEKKESPFAVLKDYFNDK